MSTKYEPTSTKVNFHMDVDGIHGQRDMMVALNIKTDGYDRLASDHDVNLAVDISPAASKQADGMFAVNRAHVDVTVSDHNGNVLVRDSRNATVRNDASWELFRLIRAFVVGYRTAKPVQKSRIKAHEKWEASRNQHAADDWID